MTIGDVYKKGSLNDHFPKGHFLEDLNTIIPPTIDSIYQAQLQAIKNSYPSNPTLKKIVNDLNQDKLLTIPSGLQSSDSLVEEIIGNIEKALGFTYTGDGQLQLSAALVKTKIRDEHQKGKVNLLKYNQLLYSLEQVYTTLSASGVVDQKMQQALITIKKGMDELAMDIKNYQTKNFNALSVNDGNGYIDQAIYLGYMLKGQYLENAATSWLQSVVPETIKVVTVGDVYGSTIDIITGEVKSHGKKLKTDIFGLDLSKNIKINIKIDGQVKEVSLEELSVLLDKKEQVITIPDESYDKLIREKGIAFGAQAKSGANAMLFNKASNKTTLKQLVNTEDDAKQYAHALNLLIQAANNSKNVHSLSANYDAMFNFLLSKHLNKIIGRENNLIVTRKGIQTIEDYYITQYETYKKIIKAQQRVRVHEPTKSINIEHQAVLG